MGNQLKPLNNTVEQIKASKLYNGTITLASPAISNPSQGATVIPEEDGVYPEYSGLERKDELCVFEFISSAWVKKVFFKSSFYTDKDVDLYNQDAKINFEIYESEQAFLAPIYIVDLARLRRDINEITASTYWDTYIFEVEEGKTYRVVQNKSGGSTSTSPVCGYFKNLITGVDNTAPLLFSKLVAFSNYIETVDFIDEIYISKELGITHIGIDKSNTSTVPELYEVDFGSSTIDRIKGINVNSDITLITNTQFTNNELLNITLKQGDRIKIKLSDGTADVLTYRVRMVDINDVSKEYPLTYFANQELELENDVATEIKHVGLRVPGSQIITGGLGNFEVSIQSIDSDIDEIKTSEQKDYVYKGTLTLSGKAAIEGIELIKVGDRCSLVLDEYTGDNLSSLVVNLTKGGSTVNAMVKTKLYNNRFDFISEWEFDGIFLDFFISPAGSTDIQYTFTKYTQGTDNLKQKLGYTGASNINLDKSIMVSNGLKHFNADVAKISVDDFGRCYYTYAAGEGVFSAEGEGSTAVGLSVFNLQQPNQAKFYEIPIPVQYSDVWASTNFVLENGKVRIFVRYDYVYGYIDFDVNTELFTVWTAIQIDLGAGNVDLSEVNVENYLIAQGYINTGMGGVILMEAHIIPYLTKSYTIVNGFVSAPVFISSTDNFATCIVEGVYDFAARFETMFCVDHNGLFHIASRSLDFGIVYTTTTDFTTFAAYEAIKGAESVSPQIIIYKEQVLLLVTKSIELRNISISSTSRNCIVGLIKDYNDTFANSEEVIHLVDRWGINTPDILERGNILYMSYTSGKNLVRYTIDSGQITSKENGMFLEIGEILGQSTGGYNEVRKI